MAARVAAVIVALVLVAGGLLELRRARFQMAHELAEAQRRIRAADEEVLRLRSELARRALDTATDAGGDARERAVTPDGAPAPFASLPGDRAHVRVR